MEYKNIEASQIAMTQLMLPSHSNFSGFIHGGYVLSLMIKLLLPVHLSIPVIIALPPQLIWWIF
jgi:hypothetical protein